jgi:hypothetical protein
MERIMDKKKKVVAKYRVEGGENGNVVVTSSW